VPTFARSLSQLTGLRSVAPRRLALALCTSCVFLLCVTATPAGAFISGEFGVQFRNPPTSPASAPLQYHGGSVVTESNTYTIYWDPSRAYHPDWMKVIDRYFHDVGAASGQLGNIFSLDSQYTGPGGTRASYKSTWRGAYTDEDAYEANSCKEPSGEAVCLSNARIRTELKKFIKANNLPTGINDIYFVLTPPGVTTCTDNGENGNCSDSTAAVSEPPNGICGYHSAIEPKSPSPIVYAVQPWIAGDAGHVLKELPLETAQATPEVRACQNGSELVEPNQTSTENHFDGYETGLADVVVNDLSIEQNDILVDPLLNGEGWYQNGTAAEQSDVCQGAFSPAPEKLPEPPKTTNALSLVNQTINGDPYYLQWAFSSVGVAGRGIVCWEGTELAPHFTATNPVNPRDIVAFDADESSFALDENVTEISPVEPFTAPIYRWNFGDETPEVSGVNDASVFHSYQYGGTYDVTLTVTDSGGNEARVTNAIPVAGPARPGTEGTPGTSPQPGVITGAGVPGSSSAPKPIPGPVATQAVFSHSLTSVLRKGLIISYSVNEQVAGQFQVLLASSIAKRIGLHGAPATGLPAGTPPQIVIAKAILITTKGGHSTVKILFGPKTAAKLRKLHKVSLLLRLVVRNASSHSPLSTTVLSTVTLSR
jgi:hypothetical protein